MRISVILKYLKKYMMSPANYARSIGVIIGDYNLIADKNHWSSEPYLIKIENYTQITKGVKFHTHGGANVLRNKYPQFDCFGKIEIEDYVYIGCGSQIMPGVTIKKGSLLPAVLSQKVFRQMWLLEEILQELYVVSMSFIQEISNII